MRANTVEMFVDANTEKNPDQIFKIDICNTLRWASRSGMNITRINEGLRIDKKVPIKIHSNHFLTIGEKKTQEETNKGS